MDPTAAKQFLVSKVLDEAELERVTLSEIEKKMLHFTEVQPSLPDIYEVNAEFERNDDSEAYEVKVAGLLKNARHRDRERSAAQEQQWREALDALKNEDHYILVMVSQAFGRGSTTGHGSRMGDYLLYIAIGVGLVLLIVFASLRSGH